MDRATRLRIFGTDEPLPEPLRLTAGALSVVISGGTVRGLYWRNTEVLRGIDYPVRDANWGTFPSRTLEERFNEDGGSFRYARKFTVDDGALSGEFTCSGSASGTVELRLHLDAKTDLQVNRAGFVILHPVAGVAGSPLRVTHSDGSVEETQFPRLISPSQPVFDIAALRQSANGVTAEIAFTGDVFEMEDQRNWSDASYKTYCRPLSLPYPYEVKSGAVIDQSLRISLSGEGSFSAGTGLRALKIGAADGARVPEIALALEPGWAAKGEAMERLKPSATLLRIDLNKPDWQSDLPPLLACVRGYLDLEAVVPDDPASIAPALAELDKILSNQQVRHITAVPKAYLKSYQPQAKWPSGAKPEQAVAAARLVFPDGLVGGGMLTNFTELNRCRDVVEAGDFITHGTTAIVHAADDASVLQTLEALPQIFESAQALAPSKPYRLGLVSIGMRSNPYGAEVAENKGYFRCPMAMNDPRQRGLFGAAWMVGAVAATAGSRVESMALAAPSGPPGLMENNGLRPAYHVFWALCRLAGKERLAVEAPRTIAAVAAGKGDDIALILANFALDSAEILLPRDGLVIALGRDGSTFDWLADAPRERSSSVALGPYGVAFVSIGSRDFFGPEPL